MISPRTRCGVIAVAVLALLPAMATAQHHAHSNKEAKWVGKQLTGQPCKGGFPHGGKFYDYLDRKNFKATIEMVEFTHFDEGVENLTRGATSTAMGDIDFVLRIFPNHHRALRSSIEFSLRHKRYPPGEHGLPAECYLMRAIDFSPRDSEPPMLLGYYLQRKGLTKQALEMNLLAMSLRPRDVMLRYNTGLLLVKMKRYDEAREIAKPLYDAGLDIPGLKQQLIRAGAWERDPEAVAKYRAYLEKKAAEKKAAEAGEVVMAEESATDGTAEEAADDSTVAGDDSAEEAVTESPVADDDGVEETAADGVAVAEAGGAEESATDATVVAEAGGAEESASDGKVAEADVAEGTESSVN